jgi:hypothetical protein
LNRRVDRQHRDGNAALGSETENEYSTTFEVFLPQIVSWVEQRFDLSRLRIDAAEIWTFMQVAMVASQRQVGVVIPSLVLFGNDVLDMEEVGSTRSSRQRDRG